MTLILAVMLTTPGMLILGAFSIVEHKESIGNHIKLICICLISGWIYGMVYLSKHTQADSCVISIENAATLIFIGCSMAAVMMDILWQEVYDLVWIICILGGMIVLIVIKRMTIDLLISLCIIFFMQEVIMRNSYGKADCHAFCCYGIFLAIRGMGLEYFAAQMTLTFILLVISQMCMRNIDRRLKLRQPVPMIPYITAAMFVVLACSR